MAIYTLQRGLVIAIGQRHLEFQRQLESNKVQFEDLQTGTIKTISTNALVTKISKNEITVVSGHSNDFPKERRSKEAPIILIADALSPAQREKYERMLSYIRAMRKYGISRGQRKHVAAKLPKVASALDDQSMPSVSSVLRWLRIYERSGNNPAALVASNLGRSPTKRLDQEIADIVRGQLRRWYFIKRGESLRSVTKRVGSLLEKRPCQNSDEDSPLSVSYSTIRRIAHEVSPYMRDKLRFGSSYAAAKWRHAIGGIYATRPLERVEMDHTILDCYVLDNVRGIPLGRPVITVIIDSFSNYILGFYISFEGETLGRMVRTIKIAIQPKDDLISHLDLKNPWMTCGLWETLVVDNGMAFHSELLKRVALELCCELEFCPVRKPWFKPTVERVLLEVTRLLPSHGKVVPIKHKDVPYDPRNTACIMFSDLCACLYQWAVDVYPFTINHRTQTRPIDLLTEGLSKAPPPKFLSDARSLDVIAGLSKAMTVRNGGVEMNYIDYRCESLRDMAHEVAPRFKTTVNYDPNDLGQIYVQHPRTQTWLCVPAKHQDYAKGLTLSQHRLIRANAEADLLKRDAYAELSRAEERLRERWDSAVRSGKRLKKAAKDFAILEGYSSMTNGPIPEHEQYVDNTKFAIDTMLPITREIPSFSTYRLDTL